MIQRRVGTRQTIHLRSASVNDLFKHLKDRLTTEQQTANGTGDAQWQQLLTLLDMVHQTYNRSKNPNLFRLC